MNRKEGVSIICSAVADSLALDPGEVSLGSRLIADLGADSLDFIDLIFTLEKEFGVRLRDSELDFLSRLDATSPELQGEFLRRETVEKLVLWLPALRDVEDAAKVSPAQLLSLISVETLWILVERKLGSSEPVASRNPNGERGRLGD